MIKLQIFVFNPFLVNTYALYTADGDCLLIDPAFFSADETALFDSFISTHHLKLTACYCTHGHLDHLPGIHHIRNKYHLPVFLHAADRFLTEDYKLFSTTFDFPIEEKPITDDINMQEPFITFGGERIDLISVPGHSPGSVAYYSKKNNFLISGDVLFRGSIGRSDLPGGNHSLLVRSIREKLLVLDPVLKVYPGHGESTTISHESRFNPYLQD